MPARVWCQERPASPSGHPRHNQTFLLWRLWSVLRPQGHSGYTQGSAHRYMICFLGGYGLECSISLKKTIFILEFLFKRKKVKSYSPTFVINGPCIFMTRVPCLLHPHLTRTFLTSRKPAMGVQCVWENIHHKVQVAGTHEGTHRGVGVLGVWPTVQVSGRLVYSAYLVSSCSCCAFWSNIRHSPLTLTIKSLKAQNQETFYPIATMIIL